MPLIGRKIRQAIDYCVPREQIIHSRHFGYAEAIASPIGVNFVGVYEASIAAREYNTTKASELLEDVFEYSYATDTGGTNETSKKTSEPYFRMTLVARTTNIGTWESLMHLGLNNVGIDTIIKFWNWDIITPRIFLDPIGVGYKDENGGYDMFFVGYDASPDPTYKEYYDKDSFPPLSNCYWIEDGPSTSGVWAQKAYSNVTELWNDIYRTTDPNQRTLMLKEYQQWCYDNVPTCIILQDMQVWGLDSNLQGFDLYWGIQQQICNWSGIGNSVAIAQPGNFNDFNPQLSNSYYDELIYSNTHVSLSRRRGEYNLSHAYPWLAESWITDDYLTWTVTLRKNNYWSDGEPITADDVIFTYLAILNASTGAPSRSSLLSILVNETDSNGKFSAVKKGINDYEVIFTLSDVYTYTETVLFNLYILPEHQMSQIDLNNWKTDGTNTGVIPIVASGPYVINNYDNPDVVELSVNPYYNATPMGHNPSAIGGGNWIPNPMDSNHLTKVTFEVVKSGTTAVAGLNSGLYDVVDSHMGIHYTTQAVNNSTNSKILIGYEWGYQEIGLNHYSPIWGMNPHDPRDMYPSESFNLFSEIGLLVSNPIVILGLFGTLLVAGGFIALLVERSKNGLKNISIGEK